MDHVATFTVDQKSFADAVGNVARLLPKDHPVPVLGGILAEVDALGVTLTVTDYEVLARTFVTADVDQPGRFLVLGTYLAPVTRHLPDGPVRVECDGRNIVLTSGRVKCTLLLMPTAVLTEVVCVDIKEDATAAA
jgi:DNA polymerase-3 subunit beta